MQITIEPVTHLTEADQQMVLQPGTRYEYQEDLLEVVKWVAKVKLPNIKPLIPFYFKVQPTLEQVLQRVHQYQIYQRT